MAVEIKVNELGPFINGAKRLVNGYPDKFGMATQKPEFVGRRDVTHERKILDVGPDILIHKNILT